MTSKGHIYMIWTPKDNSFCYIGSTFNRLHKRFEGHKKAYKYKYGSICIHKYFDTYGVDNFKIDLIKTYDVIRTNDKDRKHLEAYETLWINRTKNCINKILPFNPLKKYIDNLRNKNWNLNNKDKVKISKKKWRINNKQYDKNYYNENKDKIQDQRKIKIECECGSKYTKSNKSQHLKSKKHINYIDNLHITI